MSDAARTLNTPPHGNGRTQRFDNVEKMLDVIRGHLLEARHNRAIGKLIFEVDVHDDGNVRRWWVELVARYRFTQNTPAV